MKTWWIVVRHADQKQVAEYVCECEACQGKTKGSHYPPEGFAISAFDDGDRAREFAKASTTARERYEAIEVAAVPKSA